MHYFAYLLPILTLLAHWIWVEQYGGYPRVDLGVYALVLLCMEGAVGLCHGLMRYLGKDIEFLSGYVVRVEHYREWTERQVYYETVSDGKGKTRQVQRVRYIHHPEYWQWVLNTGYTTGITHSQYIHLVHLWGNNAIYFETHHTNCVAGGGGEYCPWDGVVAHGETQTYTHRYTNPLDQSHSIFRTDEISDKEAQEQGLFPYPKVEDVEQLPILGLPLATPTEQRRFQWLNATLGSDHQVHFFVVLFSADEHNRLIAEQQRAYWHGGNKNEFTICLGVSSTNTDSSTDTDSSDLENKSNDIGDDAKTANIGDSAQTAHPKLVWCNAFSWMDEPRLEVALEAWALEQEGQPLDLSQLCDWLEAHIDLWKRKEWKDFKYIAHPMNWWQLLILFTISILACYLGWRCLG